MADAWQRTLRGLPEHLQFNAAGEICTAYWASAGGFCQVSGRGRIITESR